MPKFAKGFEVHTYPLIAKLLEALVMSYLDWGGTNKRPQIAIVDWKGVPTWREFEILQARFEKMGVPTLVADPRDLVFDGKKLTAHGKKIDSGVPPRIDERHRRPPQGMRRAGEGLHRQYGLRGQFLPLQNPPCKNFFRGAHR